MDQLCHWLRVTTLPLLILLTLQIIQTRGHNEESHDTNFTASLTRFDEEVVARTLPDTPSETPQNVTVEASSSTSLIIRWEAPPKEGQNGVITGYKIRYKLKGNRNGETITTDANKRLYALTNLDRGAQYSIRIAALSANGSGPFTEWLTADTFANDLDETQVPDKPSVLRVKPTSDAIFISWGPPTNQNIMVRGYTIGWGIGFPDVYTQVLDGKQRFYAIEDLRASHEYVISLRAFNLIGEGQPLYETVKTMVETTPEPNVPMLPPVGLRAIVLSSSTIVLYWTDTEVKGQIVTDNRHYQVRYNYQAINPKYRYYNSSLLNCLIDDLKPYTQYEFAVKVLKGRRESTWSMSVVNRTQEAAPSSPPRDLTIVPVDNDPTSINIQWQPPKLPNGQITGYVIFYTTDNTQRDRDWVVEGVVGDQMNHRLNNLYPDTTYFFKIQARNYKGYGPLSGEMKFRSRPATSLRSFGVSFVDQNNLSANTWYIILSVASGVTVLLVVVVSSLLCRSRQSNSSGYARKSKGYTAAATSPGAKSLGKRELKPPDLWIHHHDQMELKALEKGQSNDAIAVTTMQRNLHKNIDDAKHGDDMLYDDLNKSMNSSNETSVLLSGTSTARRNTRPKQNIITVDVQSSNPLQGQPSGVSFEPSTGLSRPVYPRTQFNIPRAHVTIDANDDHATSSGRHLYDPVATSVPYMGVGSAAGGVSTQLPSMSGISTNMMNADGSSTNISNKLSLGHPLRSFSVPTPPQQNNATSLSNSSTSQHKHLARPQMATIPYNKMINSPSNQRNSSVNIASKSPHPISVVRASVRDDDVASTHSADDLNLEMANLEGLMKDLNTITANQFEC